MWITWISKFVRQQRLLPLVTHLHNHKQRVSCEPNSYLLCFDKPVVHPMWCWFFCNNVWFFFFFMFATFFKNYDSNLLLQPIITMERNGTEHFFNPIPNLKCRLMSGVCRKCPRRKLCHIWIVLFLLFAVAWRKEAARCRGAKCRDSHAFQPRVIIWSAKLGYYSVSLRLILNHSRFSRFEPIPAS